MRKAFLISILIIFTILLSLVLFILVDTSPKRIEDKTGETLYSFDKISFNLTGEFVPLEEIIEISEEDQINTENTMLLFNNEEKSTISVFLDSSEEIKLIEENIKVLRSPFQHIYYELTLPSEIDSKIEVTGIKQDLYIGENKIGIITRAETNDGFISYYADLKINDNYYTITSGNNENALEDILELFSTVKITD